MRVCLVSSYPPNRGRLSEYAERLVRELVREESIRRIIVLADRAEAAGLRDSWGRVEVQRVWKPDNPLSILGLLARILSLGVDVVHFNTHFQSFGRGRIPNFMGLCLPFLCRVLGKPSVVSIHNLGERVDLRAVGVKPSLVNRLGIRIATRIIALATAVTVTVRSYVEELGERYGCERVFYVPHGSRAHPGLEAPPLNPHKTALMFGHMGPSKGLQTMLEAARRLRERRRDFRLLVAGQSHPNFPHYLEGFRKRAFPGVEFTGYVPEEGLPRLFQRSYVVILPYLTATGTSGVFHQACGFGKPIIASDLPEIRELVERGASAILTPPGDAEALQTALTRLYDDPQLALQMGRVNQSFASREDWSTVAAALHTIYRQLASA